MENSFKFQFHEKTSLRWNSQKLLRLIKHSCLPLLQHIEQLLVDGVMVAHFQIWIISRSSHKIRDDACFISASIQQQRMYLHNFSSYSSHRELRTIEVKFYLIFKIFFLDLLIMHFPLLLLALLGFILHHLSLDCVCTSSSSSSLAFLNSFRLFSWFFGFFL